MFSLPKSRTSLTIHSIASIVTTSILVEEFRLFFVFNEKISELNVFTASCTMAFVHFELVGYLKKKTKSQQSATALCIMKLINIDRLLPVG